MEFDHTTIAESMQVPGIDPRLWISYGLVADEKDGQKSVLFDDADGNPLPFPIVMVTLQPSGTTVPCRVASDVAGDGEGAWYPFIAGDEVLVAIPQGNEREGCAIIGRFNQRKDSWPRRVAGQDPTGNTFAFKRTIAPFIHETVGGYLIRSASTSAFFGIDPTGQLTFANGDSSMLHIGNDFLGLATGDNAVIVQLNPADSSLFLQADKTQLRMTSDMTSLLTPGQLALMTAGTSPLALGHAMTVEQLAVVVLATLIAYNGALATAIAAVPTNPLTPTALAAVYTTLAVPATAAALASGILEAASTTPLAPVQAAVATALALPPDETGLIPGLGKAGFLF